MSYLIASISNAGGAPEQAYRKLQSAGACPARPYAEMFKLEVPSLSVGTLNTLMTLSDDLGKTDSVVEQIVRKIEKVAIELTERKGIAGNAVDLSIGGVPANRYIQQFAWDSAKYPNRRPLKELVALIAGGAASIEEELKQLSQSFTDKNTLLLESQRRKGGGGSSLIAGDLNDVLTEAIMSQVKVMDTEYLKTLFIAVPKNGKEAFESSVYKLGNDLVGYSGPDWSSDPTRLGEPVDFGQSVDRLKLRGSPVVPGSLQLVTSDDDAILYAVTILKGQYESGYYENDQFKAGTKIDFITGFTNACKEKRFFVREHFEWDPSSGSKKILAYEQLQMEVDGMQSALTRWCKNHYGDAYVAWIHLKVIRVFVESVLRYGLPVDFTAVLYKIHTGKDGDLIKALDKELAGNKSGPKDDDGGAGAADDMMDGEEFHDFVMVRFDP